MASIHTLLFSSLLPILWEVMCSPEWLRTKVIFAPSTSVIYKGSLRIGMPISNYHAACSAGAVFGTLTWLARVCTALCLCYQRQHGDYLYTVFGTYKKVDIEVTVTHEEYQQMQKAVGKVRNKAHGRFYKIQSLGLGALSKLTYVVPGINREQVRDRLKKKRVDVGYKGNQLEFLS
jgi:hypothetical protein